MRISPRFLPPTLAAVLLLSCSCPGPPGERPPEVAPAAPSVTPSEDALHHVNVGVRRLEQFQYVEAIRHLEAATRAEPRWAVAHVDLAIAHLNALEPEHADLAVASADEALRLSPGDARATYVKAYALAERKRDFEHALPLLREVVAKAPEDPASWYQLGRAAQEVAAQGASKELADEAERAYRKALALDPTFGEANYRLGRLLLDAGDEARAAEGMSILERHADIMKGRPSVQQNYLTRGDLALAAPYTPPRSAPAPLAIATRLGEPLVVPPFTHPEAVEGQSTRRYRDGLGAGDLDGDGDVDLVASMRQPSQPMALEYLNRGDGSFAHPTAHGPQGSACGSAAPGDADGDGDLDFVLGCSVGNVLLRMDEGRLRTIPDVPVLSESQRVAMAIAQVDADHDGDLDLHLVGPLAGGDGADGGWHATQWLLRNDGATHYTDASVEMRLSADLDSHRFLWSDVDGDNAVDLVAFVAGSGLTLFRNDRSHVFTSVPVAIPMPAASGAGPRETKVAATDLDGDSDPDLVIVEGARLWPLVNRSEPGKPSLVATAPVSLPGSAPGAVLFADMDLDGAQELLLFGAVAPADGTVGGTVETLRLDVGGAEAPLLVRLLGAADLDHSQLIPADFDGDGDLDLACRRRSGEPSVVWNDLPPGRGWLAFDLEGRESRSNRQGFGAKLTVDAGSLRVSLERAAYTGHLAASAAPVVVGLGQRTAHDGLSVVWPSGIRQAEVDLALGKVHRITELDRQPSSCPMLYGWDGEAFRFLTDCFDTAPLGLWVAPGTHVAGDPEEYYRLRPGAAAERDGRVVLSIAEFLNESLLADSVRLLALDEPAERTVVVDEGVRLAAGPVPFAAWSFGPAEPPTRATSGGRDVTRVVAAEDRDVVGWTRALRFGGFAEPHELELLLPTGRGVMVLTGALNFPNSSSLFAAHQAGVSPQPPRLEVFEDGAWRTLSPDCGVPAGFHKDVVVDLRETLDEGPARLRITTNLQVSWDRVALYRDAVRRDAAHLVDVPCVFAEKRWLGVPREVKGPENRWRDFPRDGLSGASDWLAQSGPVTPDGDVLPLLREADGEMAFVRPGEEVVLAFDTGALPDLAHDRSRVLVLATHGWVKDRDPHTAHSESVLPLPVPGKPLYP